ncbi:MAG: DUF4846 domain-containing protein [Bacteroidales bacterium]|nr:DUF4846 domain-containing protein [Bacteroidales bacterium]
MKKILLLTIAILGVVALGCFGWMCFFSTSNPHDYPTIGSIPTPAGYHRVKGKDTAYTDYLRALPLKKRGSKVRLYLGGLAIPQSVNYAVVDMPLLSNAEQCADVCMRLRAEYLYKAGKPIKFQDVHGNTLHYEGGASRKRFEKYLRSLYQVASTFSMCREMKTRPLADMQPGDVFVFPARDKHTLGHAMMVVDVAVNKRGQKVYMLAEGSTPARSIHIVWNVQSVWRTPWFTLDETSKRIFASVCFYKPSDLRHF